MDIVFTSIVHLINKELLKGCHEEMDEEKAVGVDWVTKEDYGAGLDRNLGRLVERLKKKSYRQQPARRVEIPRDNGKTRPLSIYCYEDKLVQEAVFELVLYGEMMGFRPDRGCHKAIRKLNSMIEVHNTSYILDADIQGFFEHIDHEWAKLFCSDDSYRIL